MTFQKSTLERSRRYSTGGIAGQAHPGRVGVDVTVGRKTKWSAAAEAVGGKRKATGQKDDERKSRSVAWVAKWVRTVDGRFLLPLALSRPFVMFRGG